MLTHANRNDTERYPGTKRVRSYTIRIRQHFPPAYHKYITFTRKYESGLYQNIIFDATHLRCVKTVKMQDHECEGDRNLLVVNDLARITI